jgi:hypothetical protein
MIIQPPLVNSKIKLVQTNFKSYSNHTNIPLTMTDILQTLETLINELHTKEDDQIVDRVDQIQSIKGKIS